MIQKSLKSKPGLWPALALIVSIHLSTIPCTAEDLSIADFVQRTSVADATVNVSGVDHVDGLKLENVRVEGGKIVIGSGSMSWLSFPIDITGGSVDVGAGKLLVTAQFTLPSPPVTDDSGNPVRVAADLSVDGSGKVESTGGFYVSYAKVGQKIKMYDVRINYDSASGILKGEGEFDLGLPPGEFSCSTLPPAVPRFRGSLELENQSVRAVTFGVTDLRRPIGNSGFFLDKIIGSVRPIQAKQLVWVKTGLWAGYYEEQDDPNSPPWSGWEMKANMRFNFGCPLPGISPTTYAASIDAEGTIRDTLVIDLSGHGEFFRLPVADAAAHFEPSNWGGAKFTGGFNLLGIYWGGVTLWANSGGDISGEVRGTVSIPDSVPIVGGMSFWDTKAELSNTGFRGSVDIQVSPEIPEICTPEVCFPEVCVGHPCGWDDWCTDCWSPPCIPRICTPRIPAGYVSFSFTYENANFGFSTSSAGASGLFDAMPGLRLNGLGDGSRLSFLSNFEQLNDSPAHTLVRRSLANEPGATVKTFDIPAGVPAAIFRFSHANAAATGVDLKLTLPNGSEVDVNDGPLPKGFATVSGFGRVNPAAREAVIVLISPAAGTYSATGIGQNLGESTIDALIQNHAPHIEIVSVEQTVRPGFYKVTWSDADHDDNAVVEFYLTRDRDQQQGLHLATVPENDGVNTIELDTTHTTIDYPPGRYYIMAAIKDGKNPSHYAYSHRPIEITDPEAPEPPQNIAIRAGDGEFTIHWTPSSSPNVDHYAVLYTTEDDLGHFESSASVLPQTLISTVNGLENGQPYLVTVVAVSTTGHRSRLGDVARVVPTKAFGYTPPKIVSHPDTDATVGHRYIYLPQLFDGDFVADLSHLPAGHGSNKPAAQTKPYGINWTLVSGPAGMEIHPSGLVQWVPQSGQTGEHSVILRATETGYEAADHENPLKPLSAFQQFTIHVSGPENLNGLEDHHYSFISHPMVTAYEGKPYRYQLAVLAPDQNNKLELMEGPAGMTLDANNALVWNVPMGAKGDQVRVLATTSDGEEIEQDFFLHVVTAANKSNSPLKFLDVQSVPSGMALSWTGDAPKYQVQRTRDLQSPNWENVGPVITDGAVNHLIDPADKTERVFYRILAVE